MGNTRVKRMDSFGNNLNETLRGSEFLPHTPFVRPKNSELNQTLRVPNQNQDSQPKTPSRFSKAALEATNSLKATPNDQPALSSGFKLDFASKEHESILESRFAQFTDCIDTLNNTQNKIAKNIKSVQTKVQQLESQLSDARAQCKIYFEGLTKIVRDNLDNNSSCDSSLLIKEIKSILACTNQLDKTVNHSIQKKPPNYQLPDLSEQSMSSQVNRSNSSSSDTSKSDHNSNNQIFKLNYDTGSPRLRKMKKKKTIPRPLRRSLSKPIKEELVEDMSMLREMDPCLDKGDHLNNSIKVPRIQIINKPDKSQPITQKSRQNIDHQVFTISPLVYQPGHGFIY